MSLAPSNLTPSDYGLLGGALASSVSAVVWLARSQIQREANRADRLESELREANQQLLSTLTDTVMPGLQNTADAVKEFSNIQQRVHDLLERLLESQRRNQP